MALAQRIDFIGIPTVSSVRSRVPAARPDTNALRNFGWTIVINRLDERLRPLRDLSEGWDGQTALPIDQRTIATALDVYPRLVGLRAPMPSIVPTVDGGVQLEWHTLRHHVEISIEGTDFSVFVMRRDTGETAQYEPNSEREAREALAEALSLG